MSNSVWIESEKLPKFGELNGDVKTDVLIIGGGMCGILCAYKLQQAGINYILVEGEQIASGITKNTTAKITSLHGLIYDKIISDLGVEHAKMYLDANENAIKEYIKMGENIDCDMEIKPSYTYSLTDKYKIEKEVEALNKLGVNASFETNTELPFDICGAVKVENQAQFNPIKFISSIESNLNIYENTFVNKIENNMAFTDSGKIIAKKIIVATHFPFINKHGFYFVKMYQHRSYVLALEHAQQIQGMYIDENDKGMSFRGYKDLLIIGGGGHRTGKNGGNWKELLEFKDKYYKNSTVKYKWATQDCISLDKIPYIGEYSKNTPNLFVATGFNKWGMSSSMVSADILCDMVQEKYNQYSNVFLPDRSIIKPQLFVNGFETLMNLINPKPKRCPHLGCALKWNKVEHSWDCPCHGSRFTENGKIIDNPAIVDMDKI